MHADRLHGHGAPRLRILVLVLMLLLLAEESARGQEGLWVGSVRLDRVQYTQSGMPDPAFDDIDRTPSSLGLRVILHADAAGQVRLLREVFQMWREDDPGTPENEAGYVLLTDHALIPGYQGTSIRDGEQIGRRLSAVGYDFADNGGQYVDCSGSLAAGGTVTCSFTLEAEAATNPFLHRYHPDHDNWDDRREKKTEESRAVTREITLAFAAAAGDELSPPGTGVTLLEGSYRERLAGLYKGPLYFGGPVTFRLTSDIAVLNGGN